MSDDQPPVERRLEAQPPVSRWAAFCNLCYGDLSTITANVTRT